MDGQQWFGDYRDRLAVVGARAAAAGHGLAGIEATVTSRDGAATVTVDATGGLRGLVITDLAAASSRQQLAAAVLEAARRARAEAAAQAVAAVEPLIGPHTEAMRMLRAQVRPPIDDADRAGVP